MGLFSKTVEMAKAGIQSDHLSRSVDDVRVSIPTPETTSRMTPGMTRETRPPSANKGPRHPVLDRSGTIVGLSEKPQPRPLRPVDHARLFVAWLQHLDGFAGQLVVVSVLSRLYEGFCKESNLRAFNWRRVATEIRKATGDKKRYGKVASGNGTRRERIYRIPKAGASLEPNATGPGDSAD